MNRPVRVTTYSDFLRAFGDDDGEFSSLARYVRLFFLNGGTDAYVIRIASGATAARVSLLPESGGAISALDLTAKNPGKLGDWLRVAVNYNTASPESTFNLEIFRWDFTGGVKRKVDREELTNLSMDPSSPNFAPTVITQKSKLVDAAAPAQSGVRGYSLGMRPIVHANTVPGFTAAVNAVLAEGNSFRISIEGKPPIPVTIPDFPPDPANPPADVLAARIELAESIEKAIVDAVLAAGVTGLPPVPVEARALAGPGASNPPHPASSITTMLRLRATTLGKNVVIQSASNPNADFARALRLGAGNGGIEGNAFAAWRPAPTGLTFRSSTGLGGTLANNADITTAAVPLMQFGNALHSQLTQITLDQRDPITGVLSPVTFPLLPPLGGAATTMWIDGANGADGIAEALGAIRDAINARNGVFPNEFTWRAELWGNRLAILNSAGEDNTILAAPLAFTGAAGPATALAFSKNVRHYSLGGSGTGPFQINGGTGIDGTAPAATDYTAAYEIARSEVDLFNLLVLPPDSEPAVGAELEKLWPEASAFCASERAFLIMDPPPMWGDTQTATSGVNALRVGLTKDHSAVYFPRLRIIERGLERIVGPAGAVAGLFARTDGTRGVWKAPAGSEADLRGITGVDLPMSDLHNGQINPVGVNAIRVFPEGVVSWGARTMDGADAFASEYKYVPIRRLALFLEESLYRGLKWAVFEPNDEPLWSQIRLNVGAFMHDLYRKGAFAGSKPTDAYFVKCDRETTTANDQNLGIVNVWVGFAPLKPAEFVILYLQQIAQKLAS